MSRCNGLSLSYAILVIITLLAGSCGQGTQSLTPPAITTTSSPQQNAQSAPPPPPSSQSTSPPAMTTQGPPQQSQSPPAALQSNIIASPPPAPITIQTYSPPALPSSPPSSGVQPPPSIPQPPPVSAAPPPPSRPLPSGAVYCDQVPDTPSLCIVNGQYIGGVACGLTSEGQKIVLIQNPGQSCSSSSACASYQVCATLGPVGTPTFCYQTATKECIRMENDTPPFIGNRSAPTGSMLPGGNQPASSMASPPDPKQSPAGPLGSSIIPQSSGSPIISLGPVSLPSYGPSGAQSPSSGFPTRPATGPEGYASYSCPPSAPTQFSVEIANGVAFVAWGVRSLCEIIPAPSGIAQAPITILIEYMVNSSGDGVTGIKRAGFRLKDTEAYINDPSGQYTLTNADGSEISNTSSAGKRRLLQSSSQSCQLLKYLCGASQQLVQQSLCATFALSVGVSCPGALVFPPACIASLGFSALCQFYAWQVSNQLINCDQLTAQNAACRPATPLPPVVSSPPPPANCQLAEPNVCRRLTRDGITVQCCDQYQPLVGNACSGDLSRPFCSQTERAIFSGDSDVVEQGDQCSLTASCSSVRYRYVIDCCGCPPGYNFPNNDNGDCEAAVLCQKCT